MTFICLMITFSKIWNAHLDIWMCLFQDGNNHLPGNSLQRKKSLPDVQNLGSVTSTPGSVEMTREEISVLSSSRRDNVRRQMEEIQKYKNNPLLYIFSPRVQVGRTNQTGTYKIHHFLEKVMPIQYSTRFITSLNLSKSEH